MSQSNQIQVMTDPLSVYWDQPMACSILVDDTHVLMWESDFEKLKNYSTTVPTGAYEGKMWKRNQPLGGEKWYLWWYTISDKQGYLDVKWREIITCPTPTRQEFYSK